MAAHSDGVVLRARRRPWRRARARPSAAAAAGTGGLALLESAEPGCDGAHARRRAGPGAGARRARPAGRARPGQSCQRAGADGGSFFRARVGWRRSGGDCAGRAFEARAGAASPLDPGLRTTRRAPARRKPWAAAVLPLLRVEQRNVSRRTSPGAVARSAIAAPPRPRSRRRWRGQRRRGPHGGPEEFTRYLEREGGLARVATVSRIPGDARPRARRPRRGVRRENDRAGALPRPRGVSRRTAQLILERFDADGLHPQDQRRAGPPAHSEGQRPSGWKRSDKAPVAQAISKPCGVAAPPGSVRAPAPLRSRDPRGLALPPDTRDL